MRKYIKFPLLDGYWWVVLPTHFRVLLLMMRWMNDDGIVELTTWRKNNIRDILNIKPLMLHLSMRKLRESFLIFPLSKSFYKISAELFEYGEESLL